MKIIWFSHRDIKNPRAGGAERTIYEVGKRLVLKNHELIWISVSWDGKVNEENLDGIIVRREKNNVILHLKVLPIIKGENPDVIIDDMGHAVPFLSEDFTKIPGTVFFRHLHRRSLKGQVGFSLRFLISGLEAFYPVFYRKWPFVTETNSSINDLINLGIKKERIIKIPPAVDTEKFEPSKKFEDPTIVYFGGFRDYKRPWEILYVFKELLKMNNKIKLIMIGAGPSLEKTTNIAKEFGIMNNIKFTGRVSDNELYNIVNKAWINVHTSTTEGFGLSVLEASSAGTPTVAYNVPGIRDIIVNGVNGFLVPDGDRKALTESVLKIINEFDNEWIRKSRTEAMKYSWNKTANLWESHLESLLHQ